MSIPAHIFRGVLGGLHEKIVVGAGGNLLVTKRLLVDACGILQRLNREETGRVRR